MFVKRSIDLNENEILQICSLFEIVFEKSMSKDDFQKKFFDTFLGYSYHSLMLNDNNEIVGCYSVIPYRYEYFDHELIFGLSVDTMIHEDYRGSPYTLKKLSSLIYEQLKANNIPFVFGFPNDNVYLVRKKILKWEDIGKLEYYILPLNIGAFKPSLKIFNFLSQLFSRVITLSSSSKSGINIQKSPIQKINDYLFMKQRYDQTYTTIHLDQNHIFTYKIYLENGIRVAYIIDLQPIEKKLLEESVQYLHTKYSNSIDAIMYVGRLPFRPKNLFKVPKKYEPKTIHMSGKILDTEIISKNIFDITYWNINLSNYDVR